MDIPAYKPKVDKPPAGKAKPTASKKPSPDRVFKATRSELKKSLEDMFGLAILGFSARGDMHCAGILMDGSPDLIESWLWLADKHAGVRRILEYLCGSGGYMALVTSTLAVALPMMQHHGMYPEEWPTPSSLKEAFTIPNFSGDSGDSGDDGDESTTDSD